jgi:hypothetical protein
MKDPIIVDAEFIEDEAPTSQKQPPRQARAPRSQPQPQPQPPSQPVAAPVGNPPGTLSVLGGLIARRGAVVGGEEAAKAAALGGLLQEVDPKVDDLRKGANAIWQLAKPHVHSVDRRRGMMMTARKK